MTLPLSNSAALALGLKRGSTEPLAQQLARQFGALILSGRIGEGARLPASRPLAADLGVSRSTIIEAYDQLTAEGYVTGRRGAGIFVQARLAGGASAKAAPAPPAIARAPLAPRRAFELGAVAADVAPFAEIARGLHRTWLNPAREALRSDDPFGLPALREGVAAHLSQWRGFAPEPERIVVTAGLADALDLIGRAALPPGAETLVEDPGHAPLRNGLARLGFPVTLLPVDSSGLDVAAAPECDYRALFVTPSRQFPLGVALPVSRRLALVDWARRRGAVIVEDDFDSEYRYAGAPLPALASLDGADRVVYLGSFSKVLFPGLRLGFIVVPARFVEPIANYLRARGPLASTLAQPALAEFLSSGRYGAHIRRSRRIYARRLKALLGEAERLKPWLRFAPTEAGLHIVADLTPELAGRLGDVAVSAALAEGGVTAAPLSRFYAGTPTRSGLALGFSGFREAEIVAGARRMAEVFGRL
jgi:GntR family transcriptional regulator / MocR family aminotransferase